MKAQVISTDLMIAVVILLIIIGALGALILEFTSFEEQKALNRDMELKGQEAMASLTKTPGNPVNWEES